MGFFETIKEIHDLQRDAAELIANNWNLFTWKKTETKYSIEYSTEFGGELFTVDDSGLARMSAYNVGTAKWLYDVLKSRPPEDPILVLDAYPLHDLVVLRDRIASTAPGLRIERSNTRQESLLGAEKSVCDIAIYGTDRAIRTRLIKAIANLTEYDKDYVANRPGFV